MGGQEAALPPDESFSGRGLPWGELDGLDELALEKDFPFDLLGERVLEASRSPTLRINMGVI